MGETKTPQIQLFNEEIHDANQAVLRDPVTQPIKESTDWSRSTPSMKSEECIFASPAALYHGELLSQSLSRKRINVRSARQAALVKTHPLTERRKGGRFWGKELEKELSPRLVQKYFFECSNSLHNEIIRLNNFVLPMCAALWNFRKTVDCEFAQNSSLSADELARKYNDAPGVRGTTNLVTAFRDTRWDVQLQGAAELYLIGIISIYEYWCDEITETLGDSSLAVKLQFPTNATATNGVGYAIKQITQAQSAAICGAIYPSLTRSKKYSLSHLENLLRCFRYFKEIRNALLHKGKLCDGKLWGAQSAFSPIANNASLGMKFTPQHSIFTLGSPVSVDLHGVLGFTEVILRIVTTIDAELSKSLSAETHLVERLKEAPNLPLTPISKVRNILNNMGIQGATITPELNNLLKANAIVR